MSMTFFAGHESLTNRGCEALLRGITHIVRRFDADAGFLAPSFDVDADIRRWPGSVAVGLRFVDAYRLPVHVRLWARVQARIPSVRKVWMPAPDLPRPQAAMTAGADRCVLTGGDVLSLDYGVPSLMRYLGQADHFIRRGLPVALWAASVGPFDRMPEVKRAVVARLREFADISVRESATLAYLNDLGIAKARQVVDPAFVMAPETWPSDTALPAQADEGVLGFNVSPLVHKLLLQGSRSAADALEAAVLAFLGDVVERTGLGIVLVPHVDSVDGGPSNSDFVYMQDLLHRGGFDPARVTIAPRELNAAQIKHLISGCRFFIGARTHATIAAWSTGVPTVSLGYSVKARGLNRDLFGDERYVRDTKQLTRSILWTAFEQLRSDEDALRDLLSSRIPRWRDRAYEALPWR